MSTASNQDHSASVPDRAGVPSGLSQQAVSGKAAHPLRGCISEFAPVLTVVCGLEIIDKIFGRAVSLAVAITAFVLLVTFLWHEGGKE